MEEVLFQGTTGRRPVSRASVVLTVDNGDGALPLPFEEVEVGRAIFRDGGSEYSINRTSVRMRDVLDLCRDTGLGANAYAMIEARMIDAILSDRQDDRRGLFEEAAGVGKYKDRRKAAAKRLEAAERDLERLDDVIAEVQTKVRSLARQKGKAERYHAYRKRCLNVEVAVTKHRLEAVQARLDAIQREMEGIGGAEGEAGAALLAAEAGYETLRLRETQAEHARGDAVTALNTVREELGRWERDVAVSAERATQAKRRLGQMAEARLAGEEQVERLTRETGALEATRGSLHQEVADARGRVEAHSALVEDARARLLTVRQDLEDIEARARHLGRQAAQLAGDADSAEAQAQELERHLGRLTEELEDAIRSVEEIEAQGDLFTERRVEFADAVARASSDVIDAERRLSAAQEAAKEARARELELVGHASAKGARRAVLERMERDREGAEPVTEAVLGLADKAVVGPLPDFFTVEDGLAAAVECYLGPFVHALVVRDGAAVSRLSEWFRSTWTGGGGLVLLPLDRVPQAPGRASVDTTSLQSRVATIGEGAPWVHALLDGVDIAADDDPMALDPARPRAGALLTLSGMVLEARGVVRIGNPWGGAGALTRREELRRAIIEHERALEEVAAAREAREAAERTAMELEILRGEARDAVREAEDADRRAEVEAGIHAEVRKRAEQRREDLFRQIEGTRAARARSLARQHEALGDRELVVAQEAEIGEASEAATRALEAVQTEWDTVHSEETRLAVDLARVEGDAQRVEERLDGARSAQEQTRARLAALGDEEERLGRELEGARGVHAAADAAMADLFTARDRLGAELRERESDLEAATEARTAAERELREARSAERAASDHRHTLELERQDLTGRRERIRERVEGEWGRTLDDLTVEADPAEGDPDELADELRELAVAIEALGPVNMLAVEEHEEESQRLDFLTVQRDDLVAARNDLRSAIRDINRTATDLFSGTFEKIRENFRDTFLRLFEEGQADIRLQDPDDPLESAIEIQASPRGKKTQRIDLLSGGERAMVALALLFGIYLVKPSPFCVLDEVDSPLDEGNVGQFIKLIEDFKATTQFVVMTHNPRTIAAADWIYGVTMEEPGVSMIVGVRLEDAVAQANDGGA